MRTSAKPTQSIPTMHLRSIILGMCPSLRETRRQQFFYESARKAPGANEKVVLATRSSDEGLKLFEVAEDSNTKVETKVAQERAARRRQ
jgi:hypothetical protein